MDFKDIDHIARGFHDCLRSNCSTHETFEDCERAIATALREMYQQGRDDGSDAKFEAVIKAADAEGYRRGVGSET